MSGMSTLEKQAIYDQIHRVSSKVIHLEHQLFEESRVNPQQFTEVPTQNNVSFGEAWNDQYSESEGTLANQVLMPSKSKNKAIGKELYNSMDSHNSQLIKNTFITGEFPSDLQPRPPPLNKTTLQRKHIVLERQVISSVSQQEQKLKQGQGEDGYVNGRVTKNKLYQISFSGKNKNKRNIILKVPRLRDIEPIKTSTKFNSYQELDNYISEITREGDEKSIQNQEEKQQQAKKYSIMPALKPSNYKQKSVIKTYVPSTFSTLHQHILSKRQKQELVVESKKQIILEKSKPKRGNLSQLYKTIAKSNEDNKNSAKKVAFIGDQKDEEIYIDEFRTEESPRKANSPSKDKKNTSTFKQMAYMNQNNLQKGVYEYKISTYRQFLFLVNFAHRIFDPLPILDTFSLPKIAKNQLNKYSYYVGPGNNSLLFKSLMKRRPWWHQTKNMNEAHFVWTQLKVPAIFEKQKDGKYIEQVQQYVEKRVATYHSQSQDEEEQKVKASNKPKRKSLNKNLFTVMKYMLTPANKTSTINEEKPKQLVPKGLAFKAPFQLESQRKILTESYSHLYRKLTDRITSHQIQNFESRLKYLPKDFLFRKNQDDLRVHNHLEFGHSLGNKKALLHHLQLYYKITDRSTNSAFPQTYHIRSGQNSPTFQAFLQQYKRISKEQTHLKNIWIMKPGENSNRGCGITVVKDIRDVKKRLGRKEKHANGQLKTYILQKYIERPLLYKLRKFDIRHYMILTSLHGQLRAYLYGQGYIRTSSCQFDLFNIKDPMIHLTNDAVQQHSQDYGMHEPGNKVSYNDLQKYYTKMCPQRKFDMNEIYGVMRNLATDAVKACYMSIDPSHKMHNFQVFGLDFMVDQDLKVHLIEVNTNPCYELSCGLLARIIPSMLDQTLRVGLDPLFPPPNHYSNNTRYMAPDCNLEKFQFQLIFDQTRDGPALRSLYNDHLEEYRQMKEILSGSENQVDEVFQNEGQEIDIERLV